MSKKDGAFLTIGELATELGVPQHILRYWETRFPTLKPLQRAGNRRYYRPEDVDLARKINRLLNGEGYTVRGAQQVLSGQDANTTRKEQGVNSRSQKPTTLHDQSIEAGRDAIVQRLLAIRAVLESVL